MAAVSDINLLTRRTAAALLNLQETPMTPYPGTGYVSIDSNPQKANGHVISTNSRGFFPAWPSDSVAKVKGVPIAGFLKNVLSFRCQSKRRRYGMQGYQSEAQWAASLVVGLGAGYEVYQSNIWTSGDDLAYSQLTLIENRYRGQVEDPPGSGNYRDSWDIVEFLYTSSINIYDTLTVSSVTDSPTPNTSGDAFIGNNTTFGGENFADIYYYATYGGAVLDYDEMIENFSTVDWNYADKTVSFSCRQSSQAEHDLEAYLYIQTGGDNRVKYKAPSIATTPSNTYTVKFVSTDQIYGDQCERVETKAKWVYTPDADTCGTCWYKGKQIVVEVTFMKAPLTHVNNTTGPGGETTLGTWASHSVETFTLTLPDSTSETQIGSDFVFPEVAGYVVALSDIKLVSIT